MSHIGDAPDETRQDTAITGAAIDACRSCGSGDRAEAHYVASPLTGRPVTCTDDWHDEDAAEPGAPRAAAEDDRDATLTFPAAGWDLTRQLPSPCPAPEPEPARAPAIHCPDCGETFAGAGFGGSALFLADALRAAALAAGWAEAEGRWTCTVCLAGITGPLYGPEREPVPSMTAPDTDPYRQYADMSAELDAEVRGFWEHENQVHNAARFRIRTRLHDARVLIGELTGAAA